MRNFLQIVSTLIMWLIVVLLLEFDQKVHNGQFISMLSPLQWFYVIILIWTITLSLNLWIVSIRYNYFNVSLIYIFRFYDIEKILLSLVPIMNLFFLFINVMYLLKDILIIDDNINEEFEEEFKKDTVQSN